MAESHEIWEVQFRENNKTCSAGQNSVRGGIGLYLKHDETSYRGAKVGGHNFTTFRQKLRPESSHLSCHV